MQCPLCEAASRVLESRGAEAGAAIRRRRECSSCGHRFTTYERYEQSLFVRKRNGRRQPFDRAKLRGGLARAAHKRPVSDAEIDAIADSIQAAVIEAGGELPASAIGELCLDRLGAVDRGAYLQFAGTLPSQDDSPSRQIRYLQDLWPAVPSAPKLILRSPPQTPDKRREEDGEERR